MIGFIPLTDFRVEALLAKPIGVVGATTQRRGDNDETRWWAFLFLRELGHWVMCGCRKWTKLITGKQHPCELNGFALVTELCFWDIKLSRELVRADASTQRHGYTSETLNFQLSPLPTDASTPFDKLRVGRRGYNDALRTETVLHYR